MANVNNMRERISQMSSPYITVHQDRCVLVRNRNADCLRCAEICTSKSISFDGDALTVAPDKCIGCGTCATVCPTCALEAHHPADDALLERCRSVSEVLDGTVCIACAGASVRQEGSEVTAFAEVECLGRVEESLLSVLASEGVARVVLMHGDCTSCEHKSGWEMLQKVIATEKDLIRAWHIPLDICAATGIPDDLQEMCKTVRLDPSEATEIREGADDDAAADEAGEEASPPVYTKVMEDGTLPHFVPDRRERLLDALAAFGEPDDIELDTRLWGRVYIDVEACSSCQMCSVFCPTGALQRFEEEDGTFGVDHDPGDCVKCRSCAAICPAGALTIADKVPAPVMLSGKIERFVMKPLPYKRDDPHAIWHSVEGFMKTDEVYER